MGQRLENLLGDEGHEGMQQLQKVRQHVAQHILGHQLGCLVLAVQIDPALASTIFISIGRNRRVFPRDLVGLLISVAGLERDRIGDIRVLANYSFVQLFSEDAEKTIAALNGYDYRGRKLAVSYSRQKDAEDGDETAQPYVSDSASYPADAAIDENQLAEDAAAYAAAEKAAANNEPFSAPHISSEPGDAPKNDYLV